MPSNLCSSICDKYITQPLLAGEQPVKIACAAALLYASWFVPYYALLTCVPKVVENQLQENPNTYKVTDESLTNLIQQEAQKRGLDFSKFVVVKNMDLEMNTISLPGASKYIFDVGSEQFLKEFSEMDAGGQKAIVQHELNHICYNHSLKKFGLKAFSNYFGFLVGYAGVAFTTNCVANYIEKKSEKESSVVDWIRMIRPLMSLGFGFYVGHSLDKKCSPVYGKYCEKQADLAIDDDPLVIKGAIKFFQAFHDRVVNRFGKKFVEQHSEEIFSAEEHPAPLERIAYLQEKLQRCSKSGASGEH